MNTYGYVGGNPLYGFDPYGLFDITDSATWPTFSDSSFGQSIMDGAAGFGDTVTSGFGLFDTSLTEKARQAIEFEHTDADKSLDKCSGGYTAGKYGAYAWGAAFGGAGVARVAGWSVNFNRYKNAGGGGINVMKDGIRRYGLDWHRFGLNGRIVNRPHYHRGPTKSQRKKHRPWEGKW